MEFLTSDMIAITDSGNNRHINDKYMYVSVDGSEKNNIYTSIKVMCKFLLQDGTPVLGVERVWVLCIFCRSVFLFRSKLTIADPSLGFYVNLTSGLCCLYVKFKGDFPAKFLAIMAPAQHIAWALFPVFCGICWPNDLYRLFSSRLQ